MNINRESLRKHYQILADEDIERLANYGPGDLVTEALDVLKEEIKRRGLSVELETAADIQAKEISAEAEADPPHLKSLYYRYVKPKPLLRRLISVGKTWPVYCERCAKPVSIGSLIMGVAISETTLKAPAQSATVQNFVIRTGQFSRTLIDPQTGFAAQRYELSSSGATDAADRSVPRARCRVSPQMEC